MVLCNVILLFSHKEVETLESFIISGVLVGLVTCFDQQKSVEMTSSNFQEYTLKDPAASTLALLDRCPGTAG